MADASLLLKVEETEMSSSLQLNELSILLRFELQCLCNKVYKYVGISLLMEWFQEILKTLDTNEMKQSIVDAKDLSFDQFDNCESLDTERPNSAASTIDYTHYSDHITDISSVIDSDIGRQQKNGINEYSDIDSKKLMLREGFGSLGRKFYKGLHDKNDFSDNLSEHIQDDIDDIKDVQNKNTVETNCLELNDSKDDKITKQQPMCDICSRVCRSAIGLKLHLRMHQKLPGAPVCPECGIQLRNLYGLQEHMKLHTGERPHVCKKCNKSFRTVNILKSHVRTHTGERRFMCHQCDKRYMHQSVLTEHIMYVHSNGARPYICMHCSRTYPTTNGLRSHEVRCKSDLTHACEYCDKRYRNLWDLKHHRQIHTGEKLPVTAAQECTYCKKIFKNNYIQLHIRQVHKKERPFKCSQCDMTFAMLGSLKSHQLVHSGERAFACTQCNKRLASAYALRNHEAKHRAAASLSAKKSNDSDKKLLACVYCDERFVRSSNLTVHVKMFHSTALPSGETNNSSVSKDTNINITGQLSTSSSSSS